MSWVNQLTPHKIDVLLMKVTTGAAMAPKRTYGPKASRTIRGRVIPLSPHEVDKMARRGWEVSHKFRFAADPGVSVGDRLRFPIGTGTIFRVVVPYNPHQLNKMFTLFGRADAIDNETISEPA